MSAAAAPDWFDRLSAGVADAVNPIVVKEVRQGLRTKAFVVFFTLMLCACVVISLIAFAAADNLSSNTGQGTFAAYFVTLAFVQFFVIPYSGYRSMAREREDETWVLLTLTGLGPRRILSGKLLSSMLQGMLYASAAAPFLVFSYFLNGISLPSIIATLALTLAYQAFLSSASVSTATLAESRLMRSFVHLVLLGALFFAISTGIGSGIALTEVRSWSFSEEQTIGLIAAFLSLLTTAVLLFESAAARLALATEDYARGPRFAVLAQLGLAWLLFAWGAIALSAKVEAWAVASIGSCAYLGVMGLLISADTDGMASVHWKSASAGLNLLKPGALRGYALTVLLFIIVLVVCGGVLMSDPTAKPDALMCAFAAPLYGLIYLSLPHVIARWTGLAGNVATGTRLMALILFGLGSCLPPLLGGLADDHASDPLLNLLNPVVGLVLLADGKASDAALPVLVVLAVLLTVTTFGMLWRRDAGRPA